MPRISILLAVVLLLGPLVALPRPSALAQEATPVVDVESGVTFGGAGGSPLQLDVYLPPARDRPRPAVVLFPGWGASRTGMIGAAQELARAGYVAVAADYRLQWPEFIDDAQLAVRWVRANADRYGIDPERICAYGHSSGGQLAAMLAVRETRDETDPPLADYSSRVACAVDLAGISDVALPSPDPEEDASEVEELGGTPQEMPEAYRDVSPAAWVDEESAPMLVIQGTADYATPVEQSRRLVTALQDAGVEVVAAELAHVDHDMVAYWPLTGPLVLAFLDRQLDPRR
jgi:acetyl esterase/lipase